MSNMMSKTMEADALNKKIQTIRRAIKNHYPLTTGMIATIFRVAPRTAAHWTDKGVLKSYRIPLSLDRRITLADAIAFAKQHHIEHMIRPYIQDEIIAVGCVQPSAETVTPFGAAVKISAGCVSIVITDGSIGRAALDELREIAHAQGTRDLRVIHWGDDSPVPEGWERI